MKFFEPLSNGLATRKHQDMLSEGELFQADDAAYDPDDTGIRVAPGRAKCGISTIHGAPITTLAALSWDPGTKVDGSTEELKQVLFVPDGQTTGPICTVPLSDNAGDPAYDSPRSFALPASEIAAWGTDGIETVAYDNNFFLLTGNGKENYWLYRGQELVENGPYQHLAKHGLVSNTVDVYPIGISSGPAGVPGFYAYWFTWYDSIRDIESGRGPIEFWESGAGADDWPPDVPYKNFLRAQTAVASVGVHAIRTAFEASRPATANKIRVYRSPMFDGDLVASSVVPIGNQWPIGVLIAEVEIATIAFQIRTIIGIGSVEVAVLYLDTFAISDNALRRRAAQEQNPNVPLGQTFPIATLFDVPVDQNGTPPPATTGTVFEESLVLNDTRDPRKIWYSYPGNPHGFPTLFFLNMDTSETDEVICLRTLGNRLFVGMREGVQKINWLPFEGDVSASRGRVREEISARHGVVNRKAVTTFDFREFGPVIAWVSRTGIYATDLDTEVHLTAAIDWEALVPDPTNAILRNDVQNKRLVMAFGPEREKLLYVHYSGQIRITGPVQRPGGIFAAAEGITSAGNTVLLTTDRNGFMFHEAKGTADGSDGTEMALRVRTRGIYPDGFGDEIRFQRLLFHADGTGTATGKAVLTGKRGASRTQVDFSQTLIVPDEPLVTAPCSKHGERIVFDLAASGDVRINFAGGFYEGQEEVERG